jgi:YVTN family beta-propeller protein
MASGLKLLAFGSIKTASQAGHGSNRLAWVLAALAVACIWVSRPCDGQIEVEAYVPNYSSNNVSVINTETNTVAGLPIAVGGNPAAVGITPDGRFVYVANSGSNTVSVINLATNTVVGTIPVGSDPVEVTVSPNGQFAYVAAHFNQFPK